MSLEMSALILAWVAILIISFAIAGLVRQQRMLTDRMATMSGTYPASGHSHLDRPQRVLTEQDVGLDGLRWQSNNILLFLTRDCRVCDDTLSEAATLAVDRPSWMFAAIYSGPADGLEGGARSEYQPGRVQLVGHQNQAFEALRITTTPVVAAVSDAGQIIATRLTGRADSLRDFVATVENFNGHSGT